jgi:hypothetical protein
MKKLNILLAKTDSLAPQFKRGLNDYTRFFKGSQGAFRGEKNTYEPYEGTVDEPSKRANRRVITTVDEKLGYLRENSKEYIEALFSQERTNSSGLAKANLVVAGESWGEFTSLELLRLRSIIESRDLVEMLSSIPVRSDAEDWTPSNNDMYQDRDIYESPLMSSTNITTEKEEYILKDPNIEAAKGANYVPVKSTRTTVKKLGEGTHQRFSGEWSQRQRATALNRRAELASAIVVALKECNEAETVKSEITSDKIFDFILG